MGGREKETIMAKREKNAPERVMPESMPESTARYTPREVELVKAERARKSALQIFCEAYWVSAGVVGTVTIFLFLLKLILRLL